MSVHKLLSVFRPPAPGGLCSLRCLLGPPWFRKQLRHNLSMSEPVCLAPVTESPVFKLRPHGSRSQRSLLFTAAYYSTLCPGLVLFLCSSTKHSVVYGHVSLFPAAQNLTDPHSRAPKFPLLCVHIRHRGSRILASVGDACLLCHGTKPRKAGGAFSAGDAVKETRPSR